MADWIPFISQAKSLVQYATGDREGARQTQINFSKQCPVVSQVRSVVEVSTGDKEGAQETQLEFVNTTILGVIDSTPGVGHVKGVVQYAVGDTEGGNNAMKAASRTTGVIAGSSFGLMIGGPPGAVAGGIAGGALTDGITTGADSAIHGEYKPNGIVKDVTENVEDPSDGGKWFDSTFTVAADGATGLLIGKGRTYANRASKLGEFESKKKVLIKKIGPDATVDLIKAADRMKITREKYSLPKNKPHITSIVRDKNTNMLYEGHNDQVRKYCKKVRTQTGQTAVVNVDVMSDYSVDRNTATHLERKTPGVQRGILSRQPRTCAEHRAYHKLYKQNPDVDPRNTRVTSVRYGKDGKITAVKRCENCIAYRDGMGEAPGDRIDNYPVPLDPGFGESKTARKEALKVKGCVFCGILLEKRQKDKTERK